MQQLSGKINFVFELMHNIVDVTVGNNWFFSRKDTISYLKNMLIMSSRVYENNLSKYAH